MSTTIEQPCRGTGALDTFLLRTEQQRLLGVCQHATKLSNRGLKASLGNYARLRETSL